MDPTVKLRRKNVFPKKMKEKDFFFYDISVREHYLNCGCFDGNHFSKSLRYYTIIYNANAYAMKIFSRFM